MTIETPKQYTVRCIEDYITQGRAKGENCTRLEQALQLVKAGMEEGDMPYFKLHVSNDEFTLMTEVNHMLSSLVLNNNLSGKQIARAMRYVADRWSDAT